MANGEKRRRPRLRVSGPVTIVRASGERVEGQAIDVSLLGCRFSATTPLNVGEQIFATLRFPSGAVHAVEGIIKSVAPGVSSNEYGVVFSSETVERLIKDSFKQG